MRVTDVNTEFEKITAYLKNEGHKVGGHVLVAHDGHAVNQLKDKQGIWLVVVMPSKTYSGESDAYREHDTAMLFVLEKDSAGQTAKHELEQYQRTEDVMMDIIGYISEGQAEGCSPFDGFVPSSMAIDPEYREFGGWNGWSMTLTF